MISRRAFLKGSLLVAGAMVVGRSGTALAASGSFPSNIVYTREDPGIWASKVESHAPKVNVEGNRVTVTTDHTMSKKHYIVRHTLVSADGNVIGGKAFSPSDKKAVSTYELPAGAGSKFYATSFCNLHDFWVTEFTTQ
ncbi:MAG: twin-arginine translocation signal domain-containing protein [Deltaproteobacteria bacterium]|nr:twin-arginine translocation signal domain-containing protein [Deltaproteobacteria bacterium]